MVTFKYLDHFLGLQSEATKASIEISNLGQVKSILFHSNKTMGTSPIWSACSWAMAPHIAPVLPEAELWRGVCDPI
jgi:hypothetical protein